MKTLFPLRIVPIARRSEVTGVYGEAIKIKVQAPAVEGKANEAQRSILVERLQVAASCVELVAGEKTRDKTVAITGLSTEQIRERLPLRKKAVL